MEVKAAIHPASAHPHPRYAVELEPHLLMQWSEVPFRTDVGLGVGFRASIPVLEMDLLPRIHTNFAVSFGMDWAYLGLCRGDTHGCRGNDFWFPVVMQWNVFLAPWWSVFPELGLAIHHAAWGWDYLDDPAPGPGPGPGPGAPRPRDCGPAGCRFADSHTRVAPAAWLGTRFSLSDVFSFTLRLGFPSLVAGVSFRI